MSSRTDLRRLSLAQLERLVAQRGLPAFRFRQMARWLYSKAVDSLDEMTDLSLELREDLSRDYEIRPLEVVSRQVSGKDGSAKLLFRLEGGGSVESVLMPMAQRYTLCISSQVGCTLDCVFCQTAKMGFHRNLDAWEIVGQVLPLWKEISADGRPRTNIVFMGMGEPLHNADAVIEACRLLTHPLGPNLSPKRITVSTAGGLAGLRKLADTGLGIRVAVSLNATTQVDRERLMPRAAKVPLEELMAAARGYAEATRDRVTLEYVLIRGENDRPEDVDRLARLARGPFKVNVIPYNPGADDRLERPSREEVDRFATALYPKAPVVTVRWSLGPDIAAACGQLRTQVEGLPRRAPRTASPPSS